MNRKIVSIIIILLLILNLSFCVFAENLDDKKKKIEELVQDETQKLEYVQGEISESVKEIAELDDKISEYESKIAKIKTKINGIEKDIKVKVKEYQEVKSEYDKNNELLRKRLVALYEEGDTSYLDILLSSGNISDFISNYYLIEQIMEFDNNLLEKIEKQKDEVEKSKNKLLSDKEKLENTKEELTTTNTVLQNARIVQKNKMERLTEDEKQIEEKIKEYKLEEAKIESQIQAANAGRRI